MTEFNELDYLLELDTGGVKKYKGNDAMDSRINEWLDTPEGTVADDPSWGNPFRRFQFDPISPFFEVEGTDGGSWKNTTRHTKLGDDWHCCREHF